MIRGFGDSNAAGYGVDVANSFINLFTPVNSGLSASQAAEVSSAVQQESPLAGKLYLINVGLNDMSRYMNDAAKKEYFRRCLRASVAWLALLDKKTARGAQAGISFTGTWADNPAPNPCGKYTTQQGATASATVSGSVVYIGVSEGDYPAMGESVSVKIDGVEKGSFSVKASGVTTWLGQWWGRTCWKIDGLSSGAHDVVVTQNSPNGKFLHLDWIAGSNQLAASKTRVCNIAKCSSAWYAAAGITDAMVQDYNVIIASVVAEFSGFGVDLIDLYSLLNPATHLQSDGAHWNEAGHFAAHQALMVSL